MLKFNPITGQFDLVGTSSSGGGIGGTTGTTDNAITRADGTGGSTLQGSLATIDDSGAITAPSISANIGLFGNYIIVAGNGYYNRDNGGAYRLGAADDVVIVRDAANTLALRNGANGQTWIVSRTFTDTSNYSQFKTIVTGSVVAFTISESGTGVGTLTGYTFDKAVIAPNIPILDTGWTANADGGSKTAVIPAAATLSTIATAMNLAVAGSGDALVATAAKAKAIEAALVALLLPNA